MVWPAGTNSLWTMPFLLKKAINSVLTLHFCRRLFFGRGEADEHHVIDCRLISDRTYSTRSRLPWRCFPEAMYPGHTYKWSVQKFPSVWLTAHLWFCAAQIGSSTPAYPKHRGRWSAPWTCYCPIPPQSILASVADLVPAFFALSQSFLEFCLSMADPNVAHPQPFPSLRESVSTIRKHILCSRLPFPYICTNISRVSVAVFPNL